MRIKLKYKYIKPFKNDIEFKSQFKGINNINTISIAFNLRK